MKIFISYYSRDGDVSQFVKDLKTKLEKEADIDQVFIFQDPVDNPAGRVWTENLMRKIVDCHAFLAVITQPYLDSDICHQEITYACNTLKKTIFPITFEDRKPSYEVGQYSRSIEAIVKRVNYVTFETTEVETSIYDNLLTGLRQRKSLFGNFFVYAINITLPSLLIDICVDKYQSTENPFLVG